MPSTGLLPSIQVAESLADPKTRERELQGLAAAMAERKLPRGTVVTLDEEDTIQIPRGAIDVVPAWRWLLRRE